MQQQALATARVWLSAMLYLLAASRRVRYWTRQGHTAQAQHEDTSHESVRRCSVHQKPTTDLLRPAASRPCQIDKVRKLCQAMQQSSSCPTICAPQQPHRPDAHPELDVKHR